MTDAALGAGLRGRAAPMTRAETDDHRRRAWHRMRRIASSLLVAMLVLFVATALVMRARPDVVPQLAYVRAFAEAAIVGAAADWFAITALFRHPLGLPIPHTAIVIQRKGQIAHAMGDFIARNFLSAAAVREKLETVDAAGWLAAWLRDPTNARMAARRLRRLLAPMLDVLATDEVRQVLRRAARNGVDRIEAAPLFARIVAVVEAKGHIVAACDRGISYGEASLFAHEALIRAKVSEFTSRWIPRWVDGKLADRLILGIRGALTQMREPDHPWRGRLKQRVSDLIVRLETDPTLRDQAERIKVEVLTSSVVESYLEMIWSQAETRIGADVSAEAGDVQTHLESGLRALADWVARDPGIRAALNTWARDAIEQLLEPRRADIGGYIAGVVERWDNVTLVNRLELQFGRDLQFVRINGTVVGGLVGVLIFIVGRWLE